MSRLGLCRWGNKLTKFDTKARRHKEYKRKYSWLALLLLAGAFVGTGAVTVVAAPDRQAAQIPADFPVFSVPGHETGMELLRDLYWHHYKGLHPMATLWDEWLLPPTIWPASGADKAATAWRRALSERHIDSEGYVATHQHHSIAHQQGWPFPHWAQGAGGFGWHFSFHKTIGSGWRPEHTANPDEWNTTGTESAGIVETGWAVKLTSPGAMAAPPALAGDSYQAPFLQLRWRADDLGATAMPYIEWTTDSAPGFSEERRFYFDPPEAGKINYTMVPMYRHPEWKGTITGLRVGFDNATAGGEVILQALFSQYDTRHDVNNPSYVSACVDYFSWTGDLNFLRHEMERMRLAMRFMETEFGTDKNGIVTVPWVGHEGTNGIERNADGSVKMLSGRGVGNNYWDLLPFGKQDAYATIRHYGAARKMAVLEEAVAANPGWNITTSPLARSGDHWRRQALMAQDNGNRLFWNEKTGRFTLGIDAEGGQADFGFTFLNLEAVAYGFATLDHAREIMDWMTGARTVADDTAQTTDIYHWRFAPRATTKRNTDHYGWFWNGAAGIPWGGQVQDGGAVLGFSYHDLLARLAVLGPDDAAQRLGEILNWYGEVTAEGGYRAYYDGSKREGTLQGGGTAGGLGLDQEFFESVMVPHVLLEGFAGFRPGPEHIRLTPRLPAGWASLTISNISYRGHVFTLEIEPRKIKIIPTSSATVRPQIVELVLEQGWHRQGEADPTASQCGEGICYQTRWDTSKPLTLVR